MEHPHFLYENKEKQFEKQFKMPVRIMLIYLFLLSDADLLEYFRFSLHHLPFYQTGCCRHQPRLKRKECQAHHLICESLRQAFQV